VAQIALVVAVRREDMRHALDDADAAAVERRHLLGVVGQQADAQEAQLAQHFGGREIDPLVGVEPELLVGVDGVEAGILKLVGAQLVDEADAAPSCASRAGRRRGARNLADGAAELVAAIAAQAAEEIAGEGTPSAAASAPALRDRARRSGCEMLDLRRRSGEAMICVASESASGTRARRPGAASVRRSPGSP